MFSAIKRWLGLGGATGSASRAQGERDPLGPEGEKLAVRHLKKQGYRILGVNVRTRVGEADIVAQAPDTRTIVIVEVKSRRVRNELAAAPDPFRQEAAQAARPQRPPPEASVHQTKRTKLVRILRHLARANRWRHRPLRIDIIAIEFHEGGQHELRHHVGAVIARK